MAIYKKNTLNSEVVILEIKKFRLAGFFLKIMNSSQLFIAN